MSTQRWHEEEQQVKRRSSGSRWPQIRIPNVLLLKKKPQQQHHLEEGRRESMASLPPSPSPPQQQQLPSCSSSSGGSADLTALLSDELLLRILALLPPSAHAQASLVSARFLRLLGRLRGSLTLLHLPSLTPRLTHRFPRLDSLHLLPALLSPPSLPPSPLLLSRGPLALPLDPASLLDAPAFAASPRVPRAALVDSALLGAARAYPGLRTLSAPAPSPGALLELAALCPTLQDLELHLCCDEDLGRLAAFPNLQILRLAAAIPGVYAGGPGITDVGLTLVAHGCRRLVRLELDGCEGSYDGVCAVGRCCPMLEEVVLRDHRMDGGWVAALGFCGNLRTLTLVGCRWVDRDPGPDEHLGTSATMESLQLERCQVGEGRGFGALLTVCAGARELVLRDCWGLDDGAFAAAAVCRRVRFLCIEGCSRLTTRGLESVILSWKELQSLSVVACKSMKDGDISPALSTLFSTLKELKWRPDSRSVLLASLSGTGLWKKGGRFFKRK